MVWPERSSFRDPLNYRIACLSEIAAPALRGLTRLRGLSEPSQPERWRRALLLGAGHIGDVLYNTASLPALQRGLPNCQWFFAAQSPAAEVLTGNPHLAGIVTPKDAESQWGEFDAVVCYNRGASWRETVAAWRRGIPNRAAYVRKGFSALVTHPIPIRRPQSYPAYFRDLVSDLTGLAADWSLRPLIYPDGTHIREAADAWNELALGARPVIAVFVTSRQAAGVLPAKTFGHTIQQLHKLSDCDTVLLGSADDEPKLAALRKDMCLPSRVFAGRLSLLGLASFLKKCQAVLSTDSGPRHLANAAGARVFFVRNLSFQRIEAGAYLDTETDLAPDLESVPFLEQSAAFDRIDPRHVADIVRGIIT